MPNEGQAEKKKVEKKIYFDTGLNVTFGSNITDPGSPKKKVYRWKEGKRGLKFVGEKDLQKEIDAASHGMMPSEQISRILRGDTSCIPDDEPLPPGDYSGFADKTKNEIVAESLKPLSIATKKAQDAGMTLEELEQEYEKQLSELKAKKAALDAASKKDAGKGENLKSLENEGGAE